MMTFTIKDLLSIGPCLSRIPGSFITLRPQSPRFVSSSILHYPRFPRLGVNGGVKRSGTRGTTTGTNQPTDYYKTAYYVVHSLS